MKTVAKKTHWFIRLAFAVTCVVLGQIELQDFYPIFIVAETIRTATYVFFNKGE